MTSSSMEGNVRRYKKSSTKRVIVFASVGILIVAIISFIIGYFARSISTEKCFNKERESEAERDTIYESIVGSLQANNLRENLR